jgi:[protein-PII] uridylyltransferase
MRTSIAFRIPPDLTEDLSGICNNPPSGLGWAERREWFRARLASRPPPEVGAEEIEVHLQAMPVGYWQNVTEPDLAWGLETIHGFLKLVASPQTAATAPFVSWRQSPGSGFARVMLSSWDRHGLLAKAAAAFSAVRLNILQADVFTRADNVVLDEFSVVDADGRGVVSQSQLEGMTFLLEGALSEPPRFASVWACSRHKFLAERTLIDPQIVCDNETSPAGTLVHIEAADRLGLLYDILQTIADNGLNIKGARIETEGKRARDIIEVTDERGQKLVEPALLQSLRSKLEAALKLAD